MRNLTKEQYRVKLHQYLDTKIKACGKSNKQIAEEIGIQDPSFISAMKNLREAVPEERVRPLAKAIGGLSGYLSHLVKCADVHTNMRLTNATRAIIQASKRKTAAVTAPEAVSNTPVALEPVVLEPVQLTIDFAAKTVEADDDGWILTSVAPPPSDKAHYRWNGTRMTRVTSEHACHAPHPDVTHWMPYADPAPPK